MTYHRKAIMGLSALALAVSVAYAAPTVGPGGGPHQETEGVITSGRFFTATNLNSVVPGVCTCAVGVPPCVGGGKCTAGQVGIACSVDGDCSVWNNLMDTGFEAPDWDLGHSICGAAFALGGTCNYPVSNVCIAKNHAASQNCCPDDPNEKTGWSMSPSSRHCSEPAIVDVHPSAGSQHMRFSYDPAGGLPAGCNGAGVACRTRFITSQSPVPTVSHSVYSYDIAYDGTLGMSLVDVHGQDTNQGSINLSTYIFWYYYGGLYVYSGAFNAFAFGGYWSDTIPDYAKFIVDLDPCNNLVTYTYDGVAFFAEPYGFTPPYGDEAIDGWPAALGRKATTDTEFMSSDHYPPVHVDIDEHRVTHTPCSDACCDANTGLCTDGALEVDCSGPNQSFYPNMPCAFLGTINTATGEPYPDACGIVTGSCCDHGPGAGGPDGDGLCTDNVPAADCTGAQRTWVEGGSCTDIEPSIGVCHVGAGSCGGPTVGCANFPFVGQSCVTDSDCDVQGFCYPGTCTVLGPPGTCTYASKGFCQGMGSCVGGPQCNPDTGADCCDNGCSPPVLCPSGIAADCQGFADCDVVPNGADCAFCEGCDPWPTVPCTTDTDCPSPGAGLPQGTCVPNPLFGCFVDADCSAGNTCVVSARSPGGRLCTSDDDCGSAGVGATECLENRGACCETVKGTCEDDVLSADCQGAQRIWSKLATCDEVDCDATLGACCDHDTFGGCTDTTFNQCPTEGNKNQWTKGSSCAQVTDCDHKAIPTVSEWGIVVLTLLLLTGAKIYFGRRQAAAA